MITALFVESGVYQLCGSDQFICLRLELLLHFVLGLCRGVQMSVRGREEVRICCAVCVWENYPLILTDYHFWSTCI